MSYLSMFKKTYPYFYLSIKHLILLIIATVCFLLTRNFYWPNFDRGPVEIRIMPTGQQSANSNAAGVLIKRFNANGKPIEPRKILPNINWVDQDGGIVWRNSLPEAEKTVIFTWQENKAGSMTFW